MFNDKNILEIIKVLINDNNDKLEFDFCMDWKFIYIDYRLRYTRENFKYVYELSKDISKKFNRYGYTLIISFDNIELIVEPNITFEQFNEQYQKIKEAYVVTYEISVCEAMLEMINDDGYFEELVDLFYKKYLPIYYQNTLSKTIYNRYKSTLPDQYLDNMVLEAKVLIMNRNGEKS